MPKRITALFLALIVPTALFADVALTERANVARTLHNKAAKNHNKVQASTKTHPGPKNTGDLVLIDNSGLQYFINTEITFSTSSSASAAASEASYANPVAATTSGGGTTMSALDDMFDGYGSICLSIDGSDGPCRKGNASFQIYNPNNINNTTIAPTGSCGGREWTFPSQTMFGSIQTVRKVFVPTDDAFLRWQNVFTNTGATPITFKMITSNNLGSDSNTLIVSSSNGNATAETSDTWISSFQAYGPIPPNISTDVRSGHVLQGAVAAIPVHAIFFQNGNDTPWWDYQITLAPGQTKTILNFVTGQPSKAAANAQAARLATFPPTARECMSAADLSLVANFASPVGVPALSPYAAAVAALILAMVGAVALKLRA